MTRDISAEKQSLRQKALLHNQELWPKSPNVDLRPPVFPEAGKATQRLRGLMEYRKARVVAVAADPVLLQARISVLQDGKTLLAFSPGLKKGIIRINPVDVPVAQRGRLLTGHALADSGKVLRFPKARLGKVDMIIGAALSVDDKGRLLGDGRGVLDLSWHLLACLGAIVDQTPLAILAHNEQIQSRIPSDAWDVVATLVVTPQEVLRHEPSPPKADLNSLPPQLAKLPLVRGVRERLAVIKADRPYRKKEKR